MLETKRISVSSKRQITIPQKFFEALNIGSEVKCYVSNNKIIIEPINDSDDDYFTEYILRDLMKEGYQGEELIQKYKEMKSKVRPAVDRMMEEAKMAARNLRNQKGTGDDEVKEIFGDLEEE
ncbi:AbrB/MazE/SpoVT family DNA-binding domain-containing protein [Aneurinibacillus tyrosinisolvens]|uniref:AbrB/MazE/SpoVT family DNA-binding domain-containing protein n=1 Tax=Aneurinibacillus tyrosinisolvens TaxID=1443435 RepID=UPI00063FCE3B|nr:AbrB/MazE/SpoVT family DNA-binding domain-containing protein [Aneurinibacillus tyrosinisolvens]